MGLAASQARLLTITARKYDCEFQSMQLSHQKIALSRDMENISSEYQNALGQTKLVYDYYGSGTSQMNLTYDMLMKPSIYNDYYPKLVTDKQGKAVLDSRYAAAARYAGIPAEGLNGTASSEVRDNFIRALAGEVRDPSTNSPVNVINAAACNTITSTTYNNSIGLGHSFSAVDATQNVTWNELLEKIEAYTQTTEDYGLEQLGGQVTSDVYGDAVLYLTGWRNDIEENGEISLARSNSTHLYVNNIDMTPNGSTGGYSISLTDLLKEDSNYTYLIQSAEGCNHSVSDAAFLQKIIVGGEYDKSFLNWMVDQFSAVLGGVSENDLALQYAYNAVYDMIYPNSNIQNWGDQYVTDEFWKKSRRQKTNYTKHWRNGEDDLHYIGTSVANCYNKSRQDYVQKEATNYLGCVFSNAYGGDKNNKPTIAVSLSNLAKVFLTSYVEYQQGLDSSMYHYNIGKVSDANLYNPNDNDIFVIKGNSTLEGSDDNLLAGFYDALFNQICVNGWVENDEVGTNAAYLQELMKNGSVFISSINNDGYYYQGNYSTDVYIAEVADTEAIAQAEAKYNSEKSKIENKENTIDMKMKNLDTEISSLTTEYDTTKSIISKAIEKSFKRYEA